nr:putative receptor-like protein kinase At4g00960 [Ipomoea batatas]
MDFQKWLVFLYISSIALLAAAQPKLRYSLCDQTGNYEHNSTYHHNLNTLLSSISSKLNKHGFYNASTGQNPDRASVTALCRGDVEPEKCRSCVDNAAREMVKVCPKEKGAFGGYEECMIRYSNESTVAGSWSRFPQLYFYIDSLNNGSINSLSQDRFNEDLRKLLDGLRDRAANGGDFLKFAGDNTTGPDLQTIYAVVQCSPELSAKDCSDCLTSAFGDLSKCPCHGKRRGGIIRPSCNFRYENYSFFDYNKVIIEATPPRSVISIALPPNSRDLPITHNYLDKYSISESEIDFAVFKALPPNSGESNKNTFRIVIIIVVAVGVFIILTICVSILVLRKRQKKKQKNDNDSVDEVSVVEFLKYDFGTIKKATNNFSDSNRIGQGGFGPIYKGKLNGHDVAVKRLSRNSGQGDREFRNEVILVGQLQHRNLAWTQWREGTALNLVDPILRGNNSSGSVQEMMKCIHMALLCVQENVGDRPTMSTVVLMLSGSSLSLPLPSAPPFFMHSSITPEVSPQLPEQNSTMFESINETSIADAFFP